MNADREGDGQVIPDAIRDLLEQRARYQDWLQKLDDVGGRYRADVADRVRSDYRSRLSSVEKELHGHRAELEGSLEEHRARLDDLSRRHEEHAARLEEAELRFQVGEFEQSEWDQRRVEGERELAQVGEELESEREAVGELEGVLAEVTGDAERAAVKRVEPGAWSEGGVTAGGAEAVSAGAEEVAEDEPSEPDAGLGEEPSVHEPTWDEQEEETAATVVADTEETEAAPEATEGGTVGEDEDFLDELEFLESLSLDDPESFDAVSRMLEEEGEESEGDDSERGGAG